MRQSEFRHTAGDGKAVFVRKYLPESDGAVRAVIHISHGMAEHSARYGRVAEALTAAGYAVYANDHRGHGQTAANDAELGHFEGGVGRVVADLVELVAFEKRTHPGLPFCLFGHSMGSFFVQELMITHGGELQAAVLSGSNGKPSALAAVGRYIARLERLRVGAKGKSGLLRSLSFDAFNKQFKPNRTRFDWLSRDTAEVDRYVADRWCGYEVSTSTWVDVLDLLGQLAQPARQAKIPSALPVYVFAGAEDASSENTKGVQQLVGAYKAAGLRDVTHKFYPGARHETLNELNRDEVTRELLAWLDARLKKAKETAAGENRGAA